MSSANLDKAVTIRSPYTDASANSNMLLLASNTTHAPLTLPAGWAGSWVTIQVYGTSGKSIWFLASKSATAEVDRTIVAAANGAPSPKLGKRVSVGETVSFQLPQIVLGVETLYLINETDDNTTTAEIWLSSP